MIIISINWWNYSNVIIIVIRNIYSKKIKWKKIENTFTRRHLTHWGWVEKDSNLISRIWLLTNIGWGSCYVTFKFIFLLVSTFCSVYSTAIEEKFKETFLKHQKMFYWYFEYNFSQTIFKKSVQSNSFNQLNRWSDVSNPIVVEIENRGSDLTI